MNQPINYFALDIGEKRIGIARANSIARLVSPVATITNDASFTQQFDKLISEYAVSKIIVGLPRSMQGGETAQSLFTRQFVADKLVKYDLEWQDETLSSVEAKQHPEWQAYGIDAAAACIILDDYMMEHL